jgi:hypothetical protein
MLSSNGVLLSDPVEKLREWRAFFFGIGNAADDMPEEARLGNSLDAAFKQRIEDKVRDLLRRAAVSNSDLDAPFTMLELRQALGKLRRRTAVGPDGVPNAFLKLMGPHALQATLLLFNRIWISGTWPEAWREGLLVPLFKNSGTRLNMGDYRPITLTSCVAKLFENILLARLTSWADAAQTICEEQAGFRAGRSTLEHLFVLHEVIGARRESKQRTFLAFLDARRAYDRVWRDGLRLKLWKGGMQGRMFRFLDSMLGDVRRRVVVDGFESEPFSASVGLAQGAVLSPLLYAVFINELAEVLRSKSLGVVAWGRRIPLLLYADDIVLLADSPEQLQQMLDVASTYAHSWQFRFNTKPGKSNVVVVPSSKANLQAAERAAFRMADGPLHLSQEYKYLGVESGKTGAGCWNSFLSRVSRSALGKVHKLAYAVGSGDRPLRLDTAVHLFNAYVRPSWEYACGLWGAMLSKAGVDTLEKIQATFAKRVLQLGTSKVAHSYLRAELGLWPVELRVLQATLLLFGQLSRMPRSRLASHVFHNRCADVASGEGSRGKYSWCVVAKEALETEGFDGAWRSLTVPDRWSTLVKRHCRQRFRAAAQADVRAHHSLELFQRVSTFSGVESWLNIEQRHPGKLLKVRLRAGALPLMVHVGVANLLKERRMRQCVMCDSGAVETEEHFVAECSFYRDLREGCKARLRRVLLAAGLSQQAEPDFLQLIAGSASSTLPTCVQLKAEKCAWDFLRLAWRQRELIWQRVCVPGNPWRLPAPR